MDFSHQFNSFCVKNTCFLIYAFVTRKSKFRQTDHEYGSKFVLTLYKNPSGVKLSTKSDEFNAISNSRAPDLYFIPTSLFRTTDSYFRPGGLRVTLLWYV
jgi:hypothetical protein